MCFPAKTRLPVGKNPQRKKKIGYIVNMKCDDGYFTCCFKCNTDFWNNFFKSHLMSFNSVFDHLCQLSVNCICIKTKCHKINKTHN